MAIKEESKTKNSNNNNAERAIKTLSTCTEIEFLRQTNKIRKAVQNWADLIELSEIRGQLPDYEEVADDMPPEEKERIYTENKKKQTKQAMENLDKLLDNALEKHPEETAKIMKLCCFADEDTEPHHIGFYMSAFTEMLSDEDVVSFFISLGQLVKKFGITL